MVRYEAYYEDINSKLKKLKKKDHVQFQAVKKKMNQICKKPHIYKPLKNMLKGKNRVQIGSFVLLFVIDDENKVVEFIEYDHHDKIY